MAQEAVIEKTKDVMLDKLDTVDEYAVYRAEGEHNGRGYLGGAGGSFREASREFAQEPNALTKSAMLEAERIAHDNTIKRYNVEEALKALKK